MSVLWSLIEHLGLDAHFDKITSFSNHQTITWDSVLGHVAEIDFGRLGGRVGVGVASGTSLADGDDWFPTESGKDSGVGYVQVDLGVRYMPTL
jgi:hypothetical protein